MVTAALLISLVQFLDPPPMVETLDCGLRVVAIEDRSVPLVSVQLLINAGGDIDPPSQPGLMCATHALLVNAADADERLRAYALEPRYQVTPDVCGFQTVLPPPLLPDVLKIEADRLDIGDGRALLDAASSAATQPTSQSASTASVATSQSTTTTPATTLAAIIRATRQRHPAFQSMIDDAALARLMSGMPYARPASKIGEWLERPGADVAIREALTRWVTPGNCVLVIVGDISAPQAIALAREKFARLKWSESPRKPWPEPPAPERIDLTMPGGTGVRMAFLTGGYASFEHAAIRVLAEYFRRGSPLVSYAFIEIDRYRDAGWMSLARSDKTEAEVRAELAKIADEGLSVEALLAARGGAVAELRAAGMRFNAHAASYGIAETLGGDAQIASFELARVARASMSDVRMAARYLLSARCVVESFELPTTAPANPEPWPSRPNAAQPRRVLRATVDDRPLADALANSRMPRLARTVHRVRDGIELVAAAQNAARYCTVLTHVAVDPDWDRSSGTYLDSLLTVPIEYEFTHEIASIVNIPRSRADMCELEHIGPPRSADRIIEVQFDELRGLGAGAPGILRLPRPIRVCAWGSFEADELATAFRELLETLTLDITPPFPDTANDGFTFEAFDGDGASIELRLMHDSFSPLRAATHEIGRSVGDQVAWPMFWVHPEWSYHLTTTTISFRRVCEPADALVELKSALESLRRCRHHDRRADLDDAVSKIAAWLAWNDPVNVLDELAAAEPTDLSARELLQRARYQLNVSGPKHIEQAVRDFWHARGD